MTRAQRGDTYLLAAERVHDYYVSYGLSRGCCYGISGKNGYTELEMRLAGYAEILLFKPDFKEFGNWWWLPDEAGVWARINALLFAAEMTKDKSK